jgi:hypothetical protein
MNCIGTGQDKEKFLPKLIWKIATNQETPPTCPDYSSIFPRIENITSSSQPCPIVPHDEVSTELEALILEEKLVKKFQPKYNILLKDDKSFLYIVLRTRLFNFRRNNRGFWYLKEMNAEDVTPRQLMNFFYGVNGTFTGSGFLKSKEVFKMQAEFDEPLSELLAKGIYPRFVVKMDSIH